MRVVCCVCSCYCMYESVKGMGVVFIVIQDAFVLYSCCLFVSCRGMK